MEGLRKGVDLNSALDLLFLTHQDPGLVKTMYITRPPTSNTSQRGNPPCDEMPECKKQQQNPCDHDGPNAGNAYIHPELAGQGCTAAPGMAVGYGRLDIVG